MTERKNMHAYLSQISVDYSNLLMVSSLAGPGGMTFITLCYVLLLSFMEPLPPDRETRIFYALLLALFVLGLLGLALALYYLADVLFNTP